MTARSRRRPSVLSTRQRRLRYLARRAGLGAGIVLIVAALILADRLGVFGWARRDDWETYHDKQFKVVRVVDGDTLDVDLPDRLGGYRTTRVRLWGVDTPETVKPDTPVEHYGPEATRFVRAAVLGKTVTLKLERARIRDGYERLLAYVIGPDGKNLNERIVATGHGYADPRFRHRLGRQFKRAQAEAMKAGRGLWKLVTDADLPYYYRGKLKLPGRTQATAPSR